MNPSELIEVSIGGRRYKITLNERFSAHTRAEIKETFHNKEIAPIELFKLHLNKIQEIADLNAKLAQLLSKIP
ncbi:hypothetical protein [Helicobacter ailurogastricus]|uniref:Uncharacterized protein n=1 Tax=Helicobacter ailurogastricus TaxID=1578720 RepID=A0A0K2Y626_9HELI|nr:hypothetical protein [Helicobacter ailurogastricus]CRF41100.1 hypothetical protein HAL011_08830 [Helicobacter ailurogastricus]CRF42492.1 hypothetical protein HAL013_06760 [Helicobacter ailurogastricus]CRF44710.1 hypothetical protein HAL09_13150 [Helicobacter ailurogastricus]CRF52605.1 hypothetical protein HAL07_10700 [Helicobacter ailurogastricus]BDQ29755.1 hypothetical protein ASB7_15920 [Helicobacter ailurogastricus]